jgi:hypothetical protein
VLAIDASRVDKPIFVTPIGHYERLAKASFVQRYCAAQMMEVIKYTVHTGPWIPSAGEAFDPADPECLLKKNQIDRVLEKAGQQVTSREFVECLSKWSMVKTRSKGKRRGKIKK